MFNAFMNDIGSILHWLWLVDWYSFFHSKPGYAVISLAIGLTCGAIGGFRGSSDGGDLSFGGGDGGDGGGD